MNNGKHILVVDDEEGMRSLLSQILTRAGFQVTQAVDGAEALNLMASKEGLCAPVDLVVTDFDLPHVTGLELVDRLSERGIDVPSLMMSGNQDELLEEKVMSRGCVAFLEKPFTMSTLMGHINGVFASDSSFAAVAGSRSVT